MCCGDHTTLNSLYGVGGHTGQCPAGREIGNVAATNSLDIANWFRLLIGTMRVHVLQGANAT